MTRIYLVNLTSGSRSVDLKFGERRTIHTTLAPYQRYLITDLTSSELEGSAELSDLRARGILALETEVTTSEGATVDAPQMLTLAFAASGDVSGSNTTTVSFQVTDLAGGAVSSAVLLEMAVFDDADCAVPSTGGSLSAATAGSIIAGSGTPAIKLRTSPAGLFTCTLTNVFDTTVYIACAPSFGGPAVDCRLVDSVAFTL